MRPLFEQLNKTANLFVTLTEFSCVDEAKAKYFGPNPLKQFLRGKQTRFGYKIWVLATAGGELLACEHYAGARTLLPDFGLGKGPNVVYWLVEKFGLEPGSKVACDNLFTSIDLLDHMSNKEIGIVGTLQVNRTNGLPLVTKKECEKNMERGDYLAVYSEDKAIVFWKDNKPVFLASNCFAVEPKGKASRYFGQAKGRKNVPCPKVVMEYNKHMGGVDLMDSSKKNYAIQTRVRKWYWALYNWFLNVRWCRPGSSGGSTRRRRTGRPESRNSWTIR